MPWYLPAIGDGSTVIGSFYLIVLAVIGVAVYSSTSLQYVRYLSLGSTWLFLALIVFMWVTAFLPAENSLAEFANTFGQLGGYFGNIHEFVLPMNDYHEFYLFWWFAWSIMIGQFTSRFVGGMKAYQVFIAMLVYPSIPIAIWFTILYYFSANAIDTTGIINLAMVIVGITFVVNSLDSLIRLYTDNLNLTVKRFGKVKYFIGNFVLLAALTALFKLDFLQIQWVGALAIGLLFGCFCYILKNHYKSVSEINSSPKDNILDYSKLTNAN